METGADHAFLQRALAEARLAEAAGNLPIGAVIVLDGVVVAAAGNAVVKPQPNPGEHAEVRALRAVHPTLWEHAARMTCYTTLEPCTMCFGALLLHGVGRLVFGATDPEGGATGMREHLPPWYAGGRDVPEVEGPLLPAECDPLYARARAAFRELSGRAP